MDVKPMALFVLPMIFFVNEPGAAPDTSLLHLPNQAQTSKYTAANDMENLYRALKQVIIPLSIIENAWVIPECHHCANDISNYLNTIAELVVAFEAVRQTFNSLGSSNEHKEKWRINLAEGGRLHITLKLMPYQKGIEIRIVEVIDANNNTVPLELSEWAEQILQGSFRDNYYKRILPYLRQCGYTLIPLPDETMILKAL